MKILEKIRKTKRQKKIIWILQIIPIIFGLVLSVPLQSSFLHLSNTVETIIFPSYYIEKDLNSTTDPWITYSFIIKNYHYYKIQALNVNASIYVSYYENDTGIQNKLNIIQKAQFYYRIPPRDYFGKSINATVSDFNLNNYNYFWSNFNISKGYNYTINIAFKGVYLGGLFSFNAIILNLDLKDFEAPI